MAIVESMLIYFPLFIALYISTQLILHKFYNLPPSPFPTLPIIGHLHLLKKPILRTLSAHHRPILLLRLGLRRVLVVSSPSAAEECFTKNDIIFANRPRMLAGKHLGCDYTALTWAPYGEHWRNLRRIASVELLSSRRLQMLSDIRVDEVRILTRNLFRVSDRTVEMKSALFELMFNVMMRMIAGKRYYGEDAANTEEAKRFKGIVGETSKLGGVSHLGDFFPFLRWFGMTKAEKMMVDLQAKRIKFMQNLIQQYRQLIKSSTTDTNRNLIEILLSLLQTEPQSHSDQTISNLMLILLLAGTDTSATTMEWAMSHLLNNPEILKKAQTEINDQVGQGHLMDESDVPKLPYLSYIINETLRLHPVLPLLIPHESSDDCAVGGFRIPRGTMLLVNLPAIQMDPTIWAEPKKFKPDRFERFEASKDGFKFMPFGSGRRRCPGESLALRIIGLTLGSLIQCFDWERVTEEMIDLEEEIGAIASKAKPLIAKCHPRPQMVGLLSHI